MLDNRRNWLWSLLGLLLMANTLSAQEATDCDPGANQPVAEADVFFNYGSTTNAFSFINRSDCSIGQPLVGRSISQRNIAEYGFWTRFLQPPLPPRVMASQGNFPDRVLLNWNLDPLSSKALNGYTIRRDGAYLDQVDGQTTQYLDFNVQAGEFYEYSIQGRNQFGTGTGGKNVGFVNPNGVVTGQVTTFSGNPVAGAIVTLEPTIGNSLEFNGISDYLCLSYDDALPTEMFTVSTWVKIADGNDSAGIIDLGSDLNSNYWFHTTAAGQAKGVVAGVGDGTEGKEVTISFEENPDDWHHVAMVYSAGTMILYLDGKYNGSMRAAISNTAALFYMGSNRAQTTYFKGYLDDTRIFNRPLTQTELILNKDVSISSNTEGLVAYWKFDEGVGRNAFDLSSNKLDAAIEGATFSRDAANVLNAGMTDVAGYYAIEGINYSEKQTFQARPRKDFFDHTSLEFNAVYRSYVDLTTFDLPDTATIEISVQPFDLETRQTLLSQGTIFELFLEDNLFKLSLNGQTRDLGPATTEFQHLALAMGGNTDEVLYYRNGILVQTLDGLRFGGALDAAPWQLAAKGGSSPEGFFTGLIDEVAFFDTIVPLTDIQLHASPLAGDNVVSGIDPGDGHLLVYFPLDEGQGTEVEDYGPMMTGSGTVREATFSIIAYRQVINSHVFRPSQRVVNLNASATAVGNIDFVDESTVTIKGVIRFSNTFCFQDSVQMWVNGRPSFPPIFTDAEGRFVGDFEPGSNVRLTPRFADTTHRFTPGFFEARRINRPIAGVLFQNTTKREVEGQIAGGTCRLSINDTNSPVRVKIAALNGCYEQVMEVTNAEGNYKFKELPPVPMVVSIVYHPDPIIFGSFQTAGGSEIDLRRIQKDTIDFIYTAPPVAELQAFDVLQLPNCDEPPALAFIDQSTPQNGYQEYKRDVRVYEEYLGGKCYLDSFIVEVSNEVADASPYSIEVTDTTTVPIYFYAGLPNLASPYTKFIQVIARTNTGASTAIQRVVVLGERSRESTFTTTSPAFPMIVLRDPPGDGSSSTLAKSSQKCWNWSKAKMLSATSSLSLNVDLGAKVVTYAGSPFGGVILETEQVAEVDITGSIANVLGSESTAEFCVTVDREYTTSDGDAVLGQDADLYVGAAVNFEFSTTDVLGYDFTTCEFTLGQKFRLWPDGFGTKYIYSEWQLLSDVIPSLEMLGDTIGAGAWRRIIKQNEDAKKSASFVENITFDALNTITVSKETSESASSTFAHEFKWTAGMSSAIGFEVFDVGATVTIGFEMEGSTTESEGESQTNATTVSYTLADDDPNDNWTIDILDDGVFGTPVFKVRAGESMCPWEPGTLNREQVIFNTDKLNAVNVPANDPAVFKLRLTNDSQTGNDAVVYILGMVEGSNPNGAVISVDGSPLFSPRPFQILPGENIEVLLAVARGPTEYTYEDLGIFMASECMWEHSRGLGYDLSDHTVNLDRFGDVIRQGIYNPDDLKKFYKEFRFGVEFLEPCSPINIGFPMQDWVVTPTDNDRLTLTLDSYENTDPDLDKVRAQYRPTGGDGSWINIVELMAADFATNPVFKNVTWDMSELRDGPYEIRAVTACFDLSLNPGISSIVKGRKETKPPELLGSPQPADGVLSPGDEISITFTKRIKCDRIFQADGIGTNININNLALIDATTGRLIDATISCSGDKILIVPNIQNQFIENRTLRVVTRGIQDLFGNEAEEIAWEFFVNRSNLYWDGGSIDDMAVEGNSVIVSREIRNQGGAITDFTIPTVPSWMQVFPRTGSVAPGERVTVNFEFPADLLPRIYETDLIMETVDGEEPLAVEFRVTCEGPEWSFDASAYSFSMNLTVELDIEGELSTDRVDRIGAFVNGQLRGLAYIQRNEGLVTADNSINPYLAFLTVYGNVASGEIVTFQIWDASACELFGSTLETFPFEPDGLIGAPLVPQTIHTNGEVLRKIYIRPGWNWISYNVDLADASTDAALATLTNADVTSSIKGQARFAQYTPALDRWLGSLTSLSNLTMYQYRSSAFDSLTLVGQTADATQPIPVNVGWNWIGFLPARGLAVTDALSSLTPLNGDVIKGQFAFAQFVAGVGWIGNLNNMSSPNGYLIRLSNPGTLVYPDGDNLIDPTVGINKWAKTTGMKSSGASYWNVTPEDYEFSMNLVAVVRDSLEAEVLAEGDAIGVMVGGEVRGSGDVIYVEELDAHLVFLTVYANREGELLDFLFYDASANEVHKLTENYSFRINDVMGNVESPVPLHLPDDLISSTGDIATGAASFRAFPNPATDKVFLDFVARVGEKVSIDVHNIYGQQVSQIRVEVPAANNLIEWTPENLPAGVYTITLRRANTVETLKIELR
jgi:hypothetical protein